MTVYPNKYEVLSVNSLVNGDMFNTNNTTYTVIHKKFDQIELFNHKRNCRELWNLPMTLSVSRILGGTISV